MLKYMIIENVSTTVVITGDAITAGSNLSFFASIGNIAPTSLAMITVPIKDNETAIDKGKSL